MKIKKIEGKNLAGERRGYTFNLLSALDGLLYYHEYAPIVLGVLSDIQTLLGDVSSGEDIVPNLKPLLKLVEEYLPKEKIETFAKDFLAGAKIETDTDVFMADENGVGEYMEGDPREFYTALLYAVIANYPKDVAPFFEALGDDQGEDDLSPTTKTKKSKSRRTR
ncbi:MAG: hypothetical protein GY832_08420 [Chloroflexi bacterium]|nr:hypothetical protein [Chloroflexota bacterium]